jgi:hypothetical protein
MTSKTATQAIGSQSAEELLATAQDDGTLSPGAAAAINVEDIGSQIQEGLGVDVNDVEASEVTLVTTMPDDSGSIRFSGNAQNVRDGHNLVLSSLEGSKQKGGVLVHCRYLNGFVLYPFVPLDQAVQMDTHNYDPDKGTPLYDEIVVLLATVLAKTQAFEDSGVPCRSVTLIVTDGADEHSMRQTPASVRAVVMDMLLTERHIIAGMGIDDGGRTDFRKVFRDIGIEDRWILTPGNSPTELRRAFSLFSQSAVRGSQGGAVFANTAAGGFGTP